METSLHRKETEKMIAALKKGDKVVTIGVIHGTGACKNGLGHKIGAVAANSFKVVVRRITTIRPVVGVSYRLLTAVRQ